MEMDISEKNSDKDEFGKKMDISEKDISEKFR
jgi:hypothetical protein